LLFCALYYGFRLISDINIFESILTTFEAAVAVVKIALSLKPNQHLQILSKTVKSSVEGLKQID